MTFLAGRIWPVRLDVEAGKVREMCLATGLESSTVPPPTFPAFAGHDGPTTRDILAELGFLYEVALHGEEEIAYPNGPLVIGDSLSGEIVVAGVEQKKGRSGLLTIVRLTTILRRPDGTPAVEVNRTLIVLASGRP
jgi:hypothetical protein